jgi:poly(A) polymerase
VVVPFEEYQISLPPLVADERVADRLIGRLQADGFSACRVGGAVRDRLLGRVPHEVDVATDAPPARVRALFPKTYCVGEAFGVVVVHGEAGVDVEVATFREEDGYVDGRHPERVRFSDMATDASRRDFTINALFYDPVREVVHDFTGGWKDLRRGVVRAIGRASARFSEDYLRMLRAVRFATELDFVLEEETARAIGPLAHHLNQLSAERIYAELTKVLTGRAPQRGLATLAELGLLYVWLPEVVAMAGVPQPPEFHPEGDVWQHTLLMLQGMRGATPALAWAVLLHDVGKPPTLEVREGMPRFQCHADVGAEMSSEILRRLKASRHLCESVAQMVGNHMTFKDVPCMRQSTLRRLIGRNTFADELELHRLDCAASHGMLGHYHLLLDRLIDYANEPVMPDPLLSGRDVLDLGVAPGPVVGRLLHQALELQLNGDLVTRDQALAWLRQARNLVGEE